nr:MAG TPA_asm: hypothetical protein [Caudoviricetes sp.]
MNAHSVRLQTHPVNIPRERGLDSKSAFGKFCAVRRFGFQK